MLVIKIFFYFCLEMRIKKTIQKIIAAIMTVGVLLFFYNSVSNWHYHKMPNGTVVVHSHPFKSSNSSSNNSPINTHHHSSAQYNFFAGTMLISTLLLLFFLLKRKEQTIQQPCKISNSLINSRFSQQYFDLRAPPMM